MKKWDRGASREVRVTASGCLDSMHALVLDGGTLVEKTDKPDATGVLIARCSTKET